MGEEADRMQGWGGEDIALACERSQGSEPRSRASGGVQGFRAVVDTGLVISGEAGLKLTVGFC